MDDFALKSNTSAYRSLALRHAVLCTEIDKELQEFERSTPPGDSDDEEAYRFHLRTEIEYRFRDNYLISVVFAAMTVEAYIYDYAILRLPTSYVKSHLDRLDTLSKYVVIPRIVTGKGISKSGKAYSLLKRLITVRHRLVHAKSRTIDLDALLNAHELVPERIFDEHEFMPIKSVIECLKTLNAELLSLDSFFGHYSLWPKFNCYDGYQSEFR